MNSGPKSLACRPAVHNSGDSRASLLGADIPFLVLRLAGMVAMEGAFWQTLRNVGAKEAAVQPRRFLADDDRGDSCDKLVVAAETLRSASHRHPKSESGKTGDERISLFWRIFGGTILSIVALVVITAYQSISTSIHDLRTDIMHVNEARAELIKKEEFTAMISKVWDHFQEMQKDQQTALAPVAQMHQRVDKLEEENRAVTADRKELQKWQQAVAGLQEKAVLRDQQLQQAQEEHKELVKEIQALRERIAKLEATHPEVKASTTGH